MRFKTTFVLIALLILLTAYLYFVELRGAAKKESDQPPIFSFSETDIKQVTITGEQGRFVIQTGSAETPFRVTEPINTSADRGSVSALTRQIAELKPVQTILQQVKETDLAPFGMDKPAYSVEIISTGAHRLLLGGENIVGQVYAQVGDTLYLVEGTLKASLRKGLDDWRRRDLFDFVIPDVKSVWLEGIEGSVTLEKREAGRWVIKTSPEEEADAAKISSLLRDLSFLRGEGFIDDDKEVRRAAWGSPHLHVKLGLEKGELEGTFFDTGEPGFFYGMTTPDAPLYKVTRDRLDVIQPLVSYFKPVKKEADSPAVPLPLLR